jgi:hypothetical protein
VNLLEMNKKLFEEWEKNLGRYLEETMRQPEFMKLVGKNLESTLDLQTAVKTQVRKTLRSLSIPTDAELSSLYETVNNLESRLLDMEESLEDLGAAAPAKEMPAAAKKAARRKRTAPARKAAPRKKTAPAKKKAPARKRSTRRPRNS